MSKSLKERKTQFREVSEDDELDGPEDPKDNTELLECMRIGFGEYVGVVIIVFLTCMGCTTGMSNGEHISGMQMSLTNGLSVMAAIHIFGHVSGAHVNPAVTVSALFMGIVSWKKAILYVVCQVAGGLTGYAIVLSLTPAIHVTSSNHCVTQPSYQLTGVQAFAVEALITFIFCLSINSAWDERNAKKIDSLSLRLGFIVAACSMAASPYTGASMNPARSIGPALWNKNLKFLLVYIAGPCTGGALSGLIYDQIWFKSLNPRNHKCNNDKS